MRRMNPELPEFDLEGQKFEYVWNNEGKYFDVDPIQVQMPKFLQNWIKDYDFDNYEWPDGKKPYLQNKILIKNMTNVFDGTEFKNDYVVNIFNYPDSLNIYFVIELYNTYADNLYNLVYEVYFNQEEVKNNICTIENYEFKNLSDVARSSDVWELNTTKLAKPDLPSRLSGTDGKRNTVFLEYSQKPEKNTIAQRNDFTGTLSVGEPYNLDHATTLKYVREQFPTESNIRYESQFVSDTVVANNFYPGRYIIILTDTTNNVKYTEEYFRTQTKDAKFKTQVNFDSANDDIFNLSLSYNYNAKTLTIVFHTNGTITYSNYHIDIHQAKN